MEIGKMENFTIDQLYGRVDVIVSLVYVVYARVKENHQKRMRVMMKKQNQLQLHRQLKGWLHRQLNLKSTVLK